MRRLTLHQLLDVVETMIEENLDSKQLADLRRSLYRPEPGQTRVAGFEAHEEMQGFRQMQAMFGKSSN